MKTGKASVIIVLATVISKLGKLLIKLPSAMASSHQIGVRRALPMRKIIEDFRFFTTCLKCSSRRVV